jgi:alanine racemase
MEWANQHQPTIKLRPILSWHTKVVSIKKVPAKTKVGYGSSFTFKKSGCLAILPVGYADGLRRQLSNNGQVAINGRRWPIIGRVCMNMTMVDISGDHNIKIGDPVELIGRYIKVEDHARWANTISYEVLTGLSSSISRIIKP